MKQVVVKIKCGINQIILYIDSNLFLIKSTNGMIQNEASSNVKMTVKLSSIAGNLNA